MTNRTMQVFLACMLAGAGAVAAPAADEASIARGILDATGVKGGLIVHVGCGDGRLTAALCASDSHLVHGLDTDAANVENARRHIRSLGLYGKVSADRWDGARLPYIDNLVNLIVSERPLDVAKEELLRVLRPDGIAYVKHRDGPARRFILRSSAAAENGSLGEGA